MIKPYLYGGIVLLIVGLFSFGSWTYGQLETTRDSLAATQVALESLTRENKDLAEAAGRKAGAAAAYTSMTTYINKLTGAATGIIRGYKLRDTENAKCLDLTPPSELVNGLRQNRIQGQNSAGGSK